MPRAPRETSSVGNREDDAASAAFESGQREVLEAVATGAPLAVAPAPTPPAPTATSGTRGAGQRVLCLDDEEAIVRITVRRLERLGYRVTGETNARKALAAFEAAPDGIDALITDHSMPGLTGVELVRAFRRLRPNLPVVLTSGLVDDDVTEALTALGVAQILLKPSTSEELASALEAALAGAPR